MPILLTNDFPPAHGGIQRYMARLADELTTSGMRVVVIAPKTSGYAEHDRDRPYRVVRYPGASKLGDVLGMFVRLLPASFGNRDPIIASLWSPAGLAALLVPKALRGSVAILVHGAEIQPSRGGLRRRIMRFVLDHADVVIANSRFTRSLVASVGVTRPVEVVNCGVDVIEARPRAAREPTVLAVGRLVRRKGFDRLLMALPIVAAAFPSFRCEIVGDGPERAALEALAVDLKVADRVWFLGAVRDDELTEAYRRSWCFALPVRNDAEDVEGFGIVYLEAAMASLPAIGGERSGAEDAIVHEETGLLVDGTDPKAIASALVRLFSDPAAAQEMGRRGRRRALEQFAWSDVARSIMAVIP